MPTFKTGQAVRVLPPFAASFPGDRRVAQPPTKPANHDDMTDGPWPPVDCIWLDGVESAFSAHYLEAAE